MGKKGKAKRKSKKLDDGAEGAAAAEGGEEAAGDGTEAAAAATEGGEAAPAGNGEAPAEPVPRKSAAGGGTKGTYGKTADTAGECCC